MISTYVRGNNSGIEKSIHTLPTYLVSIAKSERSCPRLSETKQSSIRSSSRNHIKYGCSTKRLPFPIRKWRAIHSSGICVTFSRTIVPTCFVVFIVQIRIVLSCHSEVLYYLLFIPLFATTDCMNIRGRCRRGIRRTCPRWIDPFLGHCDSFLAYMFER